MYEADLNRIVWDMQYTKSRWGDSLTAPALTLPRATSASTTYT